MVSSAVNQEVRGWNQASVLRALRSVHPQHRGSGQPPEGPGRPGEREGRAEGSGRRPQRSVMMGPVGRRPSLIIRPATNTRHRRLLCPDWPMRSHPLTLKLKLHRLGGGGGIFDSCFKIKWDCDCECAKNVNKQGGNIFKIK